MTVDATSPASIPDRSQSSGGGTLQIVDIIQSIASCRSLVRVPFRMNGQRTFVVSDEKRTVAETRAEIASLLEEAITSALHNLIVAMHLADSGDIDLHDVFDPDERELLMKGWGGLRDDRRRRIVERACDCVVRQVDLDIDERILRRRVEVAVAQALEGVGGGEVP